MKLCQSSTYELEQFFGCYFHRDMDLEWPTADAALEAYLDGHWPTTEKTMVSIPKTLSGLKSLLAQPDEDMEKWVRRQCDYYPPGDVEGLTYRAWLNRVAARMEEFLRERGHPALDAGPRPE